MPIRHPVSLGLWRPAASRGRAGSCTAAALTSGSTETMARGDMSETFFSEACTRGFRVRVESRFLPEHSDPEQGRWFFAYHVRITNEGDVSAQLWSRHWIITDAHGEVQEVRGLGVVGEQPVLRPGQEFAYTSGCPLPTPLGSMHGSYRMISESGEAFDVRIAPFTLAVPGLLQ
jgi:ApaG protein